MSRKQSDGDQIYGFWYEYDAGHNRVKMRRGDTTHCPDRFTTEGAENTEDDLVQQAFSSSLPDKECPCSVVSVCSVVRDNRPHGLVTRIAPPTGDPWNFYYDGQLNRYCIDKGGAATYCLSVVRDNRPHGLITRIAPPTGNPWNFYYDGQLNRYCIDKGGEATYYLWDGLNLLEERAADGSLIARYTHGATPIYGIGSVVEVERHVGAATYFQYLVMDHRGTAYKVTDEAGATQIAYTLDAFGRQLAPPSGADPNVPNDLVYQTNWLTLKTSRGTYGLSPSRLEETRTGTLLQRDQLPKVSRLVGPIGARGLALWDQTEFGNFLMEAVHSMLSDALSVRLVAHPLSGLVVRNQATITERVLRHAARIGSRREPTYAIGVVAYAVRALSVYIGSRNGYVHGARAPLNSSDPLGLCEWPPPEVEEERRRREAERQQKEEQRRQAQAQAEEQRRRAQAEATAQTAARQQGKGFYESPSMQNCLGFALGLGGACLPMAPCNQSLQNAVEGQGFACAEWTAKSPAECLRHCGECSHVVMVFVWTYTRNPAGASPLRDPWITTPNERLTSTENDFHAFRYSPESGWQYVRHLGPKPQQPSSGGPED